MHWLVDECVDAALVRHLRALGNNVTYMAEIDPGATDAAVLRRAQDEDRVLLTEDKDFGDLVFRSKMSVPSVVLLRLDPGKAALKWARLEAAIGQFGRELRGRYIVVENARLRSRPLLKAV